MSLSINSSTTNQDIATFATVCTADTRRSSSSINSNYATTNFNIAAGMISVTATNARRKAVGTDIKGTRAFNNKRVTFRYINTGSLLTKRSDIIRVFENNRAGTLASYPRSTMCILIPDNNHIFEHHFGTISNRQHIIATQRIREGVAELSDIIIF